MKMVFRVKIHLKDRSHNVYNVVAKDDIEARTKAETMEIESFKGLTNVPYPGTAYCETELVCELDAG
jgi:hypothetical protein